MKIYALVIDTDQYSGNFEREMTSYCTNMSFPRGEEYITDEVEYAAWWEANAAEWTEDPDDNPESCGIWPTPGVLNNGMGWHYEDTPENRELAVIKSRESTIAYNARQKADVEERLRTENFEGSWTREACERTLKSIETSIANAGKFVAFPAYQSVAIYCSEIPPAEVIAEVYERAKKFGPVFALTYRGTKTVITVKGIRLMAIEKTVVKTEIDVS
jgi:hypothetical protein